MKSKHVSNRGFDLDYFPEIGKLKKYVNRFPKIDKIKGRFERRLSPKLQAKIGLMTEDNVEFFDKSPSVIDGSFERISFLANSNSLGYFLRFPDQTSSWFDENFLYNLDKFTVAVHVRRTDYLNLGHIYNVVKKNYYLDAIDLLLESNQKINVHLFSDDPEGAMQWLGKEIKFQKVITQPQGIPNGEIIRLMSTYKSIIGANSTFSWWAAYLGKMRNKEIQIVLPRKFSNLQNDFPEKFLKIDGAVFL